MSGGRAQRDGFAKLRIALFGRALAAAKGALDPAGVMNPGVLVP